jgi:hypothetical protein
MQAEAIDMPERDKLAAGYGSVSDVFEYHPHGVSFPVFVDETMKTVTLIPEKDGYFLYAGTRKKPGTGMRGEKCTLFSEVVDHARDVILEFNSTPASAEFPSFTLLPQAV